MNTLPFLFFVLFFIQDITADGPRKTNPILIEGDILIDSSKEFWDGDRIALHDLKKKRWPNGIVPYDFNETSYNVYDLYVIKEAFKEIEDCTCIKFVRRENEKDFIYITPSGGCNSYVGRQGGVQRLSLIAPDCIFKGTVIHELMHTLGFWHEHSRADRDDYVEVLWENVLNEKKMNFIKYSPEAIDFVKYPYDYKSVLHYSAYDFSKSPRLPTIKPKSSNIRLRELGRAQAIGTLTEIDKQKINDLYECKYNVK